VGESDEGFARVAAELEGGPVVALVAAFPELAVGEAGEQSALGSEKYAWQFIIDRPLV
jgi:hypothetical protein